MLSIYDKLHLVPFGEYLPFQDWMEKLGFVQLTKVQGGFIPGTRRRTMEIPNAPRALPLICYETIFPGDIAAHDDRPGWIVNLTNDGWFGISTGPYQHLQQARLRAIEEGLPVVRAANTGISAVIDPMGRVTATLGLGIEGVLDASLPSAIAPTVYARSGDIPVAILIAAALAFRHSATRCEAGFLTSAFSGPASVAAEASASGNPRLTDRPCHSHSVVEVENRSSQLVAQSGFVRPLRARFDGMAPEA